MFEYFPDNYNWSLAVALAIGMGGEPSEIDSACRPLRDLARAAVDDATQQAWFDSWTAVADRLEDLAARDECAGHAQSAARKRRRVAAYHLMAERMMTNLSPLKMESYQKALEAFRSATSGLEESIEYLEVPYEGGRMPSLFVAGKGTGKQPCLVFFNGYDVTKEVLYLMGLGDLAKRGISVLLCDQPGSGGALRLYDLKTRFDMEVAGSACFDAMAARPDVDESKIAIGAISMGGYFAPRAASVDHRFAACVAWGAFHDLLGVAANLAQTARPLGAAVPGAVGVRNGAGQAAGVRADLQPRLSDRRNDVPPPGHAWGIRPAGAGGTGPTNVRDGYLFFTSRPAGLPEGQLGRGALPGG